MTDRDKQRLAQRTPVTCVTPPPPVAPVFAPPAAPDCDPPFVIPPEVFVPASPATPVIAPDVVLPNPLTVGNTTQSAVCADVEGGPPTGATQTVAANALTSTVSFADVPGITQSQLAYIGTFSQDQLDALVTDTAVAIGAATTLNAVQSLWLFNAMAAQVAALNAVAASQALAMLSCVWLNASQTATCSSGALTTSPPAPSGSVNNPVTVASGLFFSTTSQADANAQALNEATLSLLCLWGNAAVTQNCTNLTPSLPAVPFVDSEPINASYGRLRIGTVTVAANTVFSGDSQAAADALAVAAALASLSCFYYNTAVTQGCADVTTQTYPAVPHGNPTTQVLGNPAIIPAAFLISEISVADANAQAAALADTLLLCNWVNASQTATCPTETLAPGTLPGQTDPMEIPPSSTSPNITATVAAGAITSYVSQANADSQALASAEAQLSCLYCNLVIPAVCASPGNSTDTTTGVAAGTYCSPDAVAAAQVAQSIAAIPIKVLATGLQCSYTNTQVTAQCIESLGIVGNFMMDGSPWSQDDPSTGLPALSLSASNALAATLGLCATSTPNPFSTDPTQAYVIIAPGVVTVTTPFPDAIVAEYPTNTGQLYANSLARTLARSLMSCVFQNNQTVVLCGSTGGSSPVVTTPGGLKTLTYGSGHLAGGDAAAPTANGSTTSPIVIAAGSQFSFVSLAQANEFALLNALSQLDCYVVNTAQTEVCDATDSAPVTGVDPPVGTPVPGSVLTQTVAAGAFRSYTSVAEANSVASTIAEGMLVCLWTNVTCTSNNTCPGGTFGVAAVLPAGVTTSTVGPIDAQNLGQLLANGLQQCFTPSDFPPGSPGRDGTNGTNGTDGAPGSGGPQTGCTGNCLSFYS
jgi:uncharacterized protein DUF5977